MKRKIRLTESDLHKIIQESVYNYLAENNEDEGFGDWFKGAFGKLGKDAGAAAGRAGNAVAGAAQRGAQAGKNAAQRAGNAIGGAAQRAGQAMGNAGRAVAGAAQRGAQAVGNAAGRAGNAVAGAAQRGAQAVGNYASAVNQAGKNSSAAGDINNIIKQLTASKANLLKAAQSVGNRNLGKSLQSTINNLQVVAQALSGGQANWGK